MVDYPIGDLIAERVRAMGVQPFYKRFKHDGARGPNMATVYSDRGHGVRGPVVFYNRANEAAALLKPGDFDWKAIFGAGVRWFHSGGIFAALSETTAELIIEAMQAAQGARRRRVVRPQLPREALERRPAARARAAEVLGRIVEHVDVLVGNEEDLQKGLGIPGPRSRRSRSSIPASSSAMIDRVVETLPADQGRRDDAARSALDQPPHAGARWRGSTARPTSAPTCELDVHDRVGGGDGFASGFFYGLLTGETPEEAVQARLGARRAAHDVPRRHDDGDARAGARVRARRLGADSAMTRTVMTKDDVWGVYSVPPLPRQGRTGDAVSTSTPRNSSPPTSIAAASRSSSTAATPSSITSRSTSSTSCSAGSTPSRPAACRFQASARRSAGRWIRPGCCGATRFPAR